MHFPHRINTVGASLEELILDDATIWVSDVTVAYGFVDRKAEICPAEISDSLSVSVNTFQTMKSFVSERKKMYHVVLNRQMSYVKLRPVSEMQSGRFFACEPLKTELAVLEENFTVWISVYFKPLPNGEERGAGSQWDKSYLKLSTSGTNKARIISTKIGVDRVVGSCDTHSFLKWSIFSCMQNWEFHHLNRLRLSVICIAYLKYK